MQEWVRKHQQARRDHGGVNPLEVWHATTDSTLNLMQSPRECQEGCKEQFEDAEGETSFSFLEWLEGLKGWRWVGKEEDAS